jgi:hypothetical protein
VRRVSLLVQERGVDRSEPVEMLLRHVDIPLANVR